jgi:FkbM family methyltransferase
MKQNGKKTGLNLIKLWVNILSKLLGVSNIVRIKENINLTGKMDYAHGEIYMVLDSSIQLWRLNACKKEPETVNWIETYFQPGDVMYDIGANVGAYSFVAYKATGGNCKIYAFEPSFTTFAALSKNIFLNGCHEKIIPLHVALAQETNLITFNYSSIAPGAALHSMGKPINERGQLFQPVFVQPILSYRLDDFFHQFTLTPPNHMKIDVDGAELNVLRGATEILSQPNLRSILIEVDEGQYFTAEIISLLKEKGFQIRSKHPRNQKGVFNYIFERHHLEKTMTGGNL